MSAEQAGRTRVAAHVNAGAEAAARRAAGPVR